MVKFAPTNDTLDGVSFASYTKNNGRDISITHCIKVTDRTVYSCIVVNSYGYNAVNLHKSIHKAETCNISDELWFTFILFLHVTFIGYMSEGLNSWSLNPIFQRPKIIALEIKYCVDQHSNYLTINFGSIDLMPSVLLPIWSIVLWICLFYIDVVVNTNGLQQWPDRIKWQRWSWWFIVGKHSSHLTKQFVKAWDNGLCVRCTPMELFKRFFVKHFEAIILKSDLGNGKETKKVRLSLADIEVLLQISHILNLNTLDDRLHTSGTTDHWFPFINMD